MKRIGKLVPIIIVLNLLLTGCKGDIDYMIEEYNSRFGIHDDNYLLPGDLGYDQESMLQDSYDFPSNAHINVYAPVVKGATYRWSILDDNTRTDVGLTFPSSTDSHFHVYIPNSGLAVDAYILKLEVTIGEMKLVDTAKMFIEESS